MTPREMLDPKVPCTCHEQTSHRESRTPETGHHFFCTRHYHAYKQWIKHRRNQMKRLSKWEIKDTEFTTVIVTPE